MEQRRRVCSRVRTFVTRSYNPTRGNFIPLRVQHNGIPPGYVENDLLAGVSSRDFNNQLTHSEVIAKEGSEDIIRRTGLVMIPENPFNRKRDILVIAEAQEFPAEPVEPDFFGWIYKPATKNIRVNWPGVDKDGVRYFDY